MSQQEQITINLVSNASTSTFRDNTLANFTTLLPHPIQLMGDWEVAIVEMSWPNLAQNVLQGNFSYQFINCQEKDARPPPRHRRPGMVTMYTPNKSLGESFAPPSVVNKKRGIYSSIDLIMDSICKQVFRDNLASSSKQFPISWKIDAQTQTLRVKFSGRNDDRLILKAKSADLRNILSMTTLVDCSSSPSNAKDRSEDGNGGGGGGVHDAFQTKSAGQYPTDLNAGCHTILIYCDLVQNQILGDCQTALLRAIPLPTFHHQNQPNDCKSLSTRVSVNHQPAAFTSLHYHTLTNLQWKRIVKTTVQSISISLPNETGKLVPFLSRGRTNVTLQFRKRLE